MEQLTEFTVLANGDLKIALTDAGKMALVEQFNSDGYDPLRAWDDAIEYEVCNGFSSFDPAQHGLTDCPYGIAAALDDAGAPAGAYWWYPQYEVSDPIDRLITHGAVTLTFAGDTYTDPDD